MGEPPPPLVAPAVLELPALPFGTEVVDPHDTAHKAPKIPNPIQLCANPMRRVVAHLEPIATRDRSLPTQQLLAQLRAGAVEARLHRR